MHKKHISLFFTPLSLSWFDVRILLVLFPRHGDFAVNVKIEISRQGIASATSPSHSISGNIGKNTCNTGAYQWHSTSNGMIFFSVMFYSFLYLSQVEAIQNWLHFLRLLHFFFRYLWPHCKILIGEKSGKNDG